MSDLCPDCLGEGKVDLGDERGSWLPCVCTLEAEPDPEVWLRDLDGTGSMHVCTPHCPGAIKYIREDLVP